MICIFVLSKTKMMKFLTALSIAALPFFGMAQSVDQQVIASAGEHFDNGTTQLSWTLGEVMIDTYDNGTNILTQGFHQTELTVTAIEETLANIRMNLYPNPTSEFLNIDLGNNDKDINLQLFDMSGKLIHQAVIYAYQNRFVLPMNEVATGKYLVQMRTDDGKFNTTHRVLKVGLSD
ncbi:MAG: T9SS type A sorting domain-containing protein [Flavobacteriales bacterium]|nr:T9SS type A sorting domain-containing protein [Flavobacteriales bacterium]